MGFQSGRTDGYRAFQGTWTEGRPRDEQPEAEAGRQARGPEDRGAAAGRRDHAGLGEPTEESGAGEESGPGAGAEGACRPGRARGPVWDNRRPVAGRRAFPGHHRGPGSWAVIADHRQAGCERRVPRAQSGVRSWGPGAGRSAALSLALRRPRLLTWP